MFASITSLRYIIKVVVTTPRKRLCPLESCIIACGMILYFYRPAGGELDDILYVTRSAQRHARAAYHVFIIISSA